MQGSESHSGVGKLYDFLFVAANAYSQEATLSFFRRQLSAEVLFEKWLYYLSTLLATNPPAIPGKTLSETKDKPDHPSQPTTNIHSVTIQRSNLSPLKALGTITDHISPHFWVHRLKNPTSRCPEIAKRSHVSEGKPWSFWKPCPKNSACHRSVNDLPAKICQPSPHLTSVKIGAWLLRANNLQPKKRGKTTGGGFNPAKIFSIVKLAFNCPNYITQNTSQKKCFKSTVSLNSMFIYYCFLNQNCIHHFHLHPNAGGTAAPVVPPPSSRWLPEILKRRVVNNTTSRGSSPQGPAAKKQGGKKYE